MKQIILSILLVILLSSCNNSPWHHSNIVEDFLVEVISLNVGETFTLDIKEQYKESNISIKKFYIESSDKAVVSTRNQTITALSMGRARISVVLSDTTNRTHYYSTAGYVYVIDESKMTAINTAEDLANISNDLHGHYIIKNDIDLTGYGNWDPIGHSELYFAGDFQGFLVNPYGYKITNLNIDTDSGFDEHHAGLFYSIYNAYVSGIILENISINNNITTYQDGGTSGGIAGMAFTSAIINCYVEGNIIGSDSVGGIVGVNEGSRIIDCRFNGSITALEMTDYLLVSAGGIAGFDSSMLVYNFGGIFNFQVEGSIASFYYAGGISGYAFRNYSIINSEFTGTLTGQVTGQLIGFYRN